MVWWEIFAFSQHLDMFSGGKRRSMFLRSIYIFRKISVLLRGPLCLNPMDTGLEFSVPISTICEWSLGTFASQTGIYQA